MPVSTLPLQLDLTIYAGTNFRREFRWLPDGTTGQDFTGWSGVLLIGIANGASSQQHDVTLATDGTLAIELSTADTAALTGNNLIYQVDLTDPSNFIIRFLRGRVTAVHDLRRITP